MRYDKNTVKDKAAADITCPQPLKVHEQNLRLGYIQQQSARPSPVQLVPIPIRLSYCVCITHSPRHIGTNGERQRSAGPTVLHKEAAVLRTEVSNPLPKVYFPSSKRKRPHHQQALTRLVGEITECLPNNFTTAGSVYRH